MGVLAIVLGLFPALPQASFEDKLLSTIPEGTDAGEFLFSPDGRFVTYRVRAGNKGFVMLNKEKGPEFTNVLDAPRFAQDGRTVYYRAQSGKVCVVVGRRQEPLYEEVGEPVLSPDGRKVAYSASNGRTWVAIIGSTRYGGDLHYAGTPVFNSIGTSWAVPVRVAKDASGKIIASGVASRTKEIMVVDGKPGEEFDKIEDPVFAPGSGVVAYRARIGIDVGVNEQWCMVVGTKRGDTSPVLGRPRYTADGRLVYTLGSEGKFWVVVDGRRSEEYDSVSDPVFSPDGRSIAYAATKGGKSFIVMDGKRLPEYAGVQDPVISPDGRKAAYAAAQGGKWVMVAGDKPGSPMDFIGPAVWSPDSAQVAHMAQWNNFAVMVVGGARTELFESVGTPAWSPDGSRAAHSARKLKAVYMVISHRRSDEVFDEIYGTPVFSPDGRKVAFGARKGRDLLWRVLPVPQ